MFNEIIVYDDNFVYNRLSTIAEVYFNIWKNIENIVNISEKNWMSIHINLESKSDAFKMYSLELKDCKLVNLKFDKLSWQKKMKWIIELTLYDYSVFVVWRTIQIHEKDSIRKDRVIVDIRDLNKISEFDVYLMSLQSDILAFVLECLYISVINCASFFH